MKPLVPFHIISPSGRNREERRKNSGHLVRDSTRKPLGPITFSYLCGVDAYHSLFLQLMSFDKSYMIVLFHFIFYSKLFQMFTVNSEMAQVYIRPMGCLFNIK